MVGAKRGNFLHMFDYLFYSIDLFIHPRSKHSIGVLLQMFSLVGQLIISECRSNYTREKRATIMSS